MNVWVVLPTYNEAENLEPLVVSLKQLPVEVGVVVVDDGSPDGTGALADALAGQWPRVEVIHRAGRQGLGTAYLAGFRHALARGADAVLTMDCDFSHDPAAVPDFVAALQAADVAIGSRYIPGGEIRNWPAHRRLLSRAANRFARALFGLPVRDCTSGFRLYRRAVLEALPWDRVRSSGYAFLVETLYWVTRIEGARVREVPICFTDRERGETKMGWREAVHGARNLIQLRMSLGRPAGRERRV